MTATAVATPDTPEWYAARNSGVGASEAAAAAGLDPEYATPLELFHRKIGNLPEPDETDAMRVGKWMEPGVISEFAHATGINAKQYPVPMLRHGEHSFVLATPDAILESDELLECKTSTWRMRDKLGDEGSDEIPESWLCQSQQQMAVTGFSVCHLAVFLDGRTLRTFRVERNDALIELLIEAERELWERIQNNDPPEAHWEHPSTPQLIREIYGNVTDGKVIDLSASGAQRWARYQEIGKQIRELKAEQDICKAKVLDEIGDAYAGLLPDGEKMIRRKLIEKKPYTVEPKPYVDARMVNAK